MSDAIGITKTIFTVQNPWVLTDGSVFAMGLDAKQLLVIAAAAIVLFSVSSMHYLGKNMRGMILGTNIFIRWSIVCIMLFTVLIFGIYGPGYSESQFIYFQF